jgi:hypothetical protein
MGVRRGFSHGAVSGVRGNVVIGLAFAISGTLAAVVPVYPRSRSLSHVMGVPLALYAFVAVVIGGMGVSSAPSRRISRWHHRHLPAGIPAAGFKGVPRRVRIRSSYPCPVVASRGSDQTKSAIERV